MAKKKSSINALRKQFRQLNVLLKPKTMGVLKKMSRISGMSMTHFVASLIELESTDRHWMGKL